LWSGKQIFNAIIRLNNSYKDIINIRVKGKAYCGKGEDLCSNDGCKLESLIKKILINE